MSEKPQDEQLSGKVVCDVDHWWVRAVDPHPWQATCVNPRPAQPQALADDLDALGEARLLLANMRRDGVAPHCVQQLEYLLGRAAPSAPSDALRQSLEELAIEWDRRSEDLFDSEPHTSQDYLARAKELRSALAASSSVTRDAINEAWIKGCLAGREEAARLAAANERHATAEKIRNLPAPTAPKEPQR